MGSAAAEKIGTLIVTIYIYIYVLQIVSKALVEMACDICVVSFGSKHRCSDSKL